MDKQKSYNLSTSHVAAASTDSKFVASRATRALFLKWIAES